MAIVQVSAQFHRRADADAARQRLIDAGFAATAIRVADPAARDDQTTARSATRVLPDPAAIKDAIPRGDDDGAPLGGIVVLAEIDEARRDAALAALHADRGAVVDLSGRRDGPVDNDRVRSPDYDDGVHDAA